MNELENKTIESQCQSCFHDTIGIIEQEENRMQVNNIKIEKGLL